MLISDKMCKTADRLDCRLLLIGLVVVRRRRAAQRVVVPQHSGQVSVGHVLEYHVRRLVLCTETGNKNVRPMCRWTTEATRLRYGAFIEIYIGFCQQDIHKTADTHQSTEHRKLDSNVSLKRRIVFDRHYALLVTIRRISD